MGRWPGLLLVLAYLVSLGFRPVGLVDGEPMTTAVTPAAAAALAEDDAPALSARAALLLDEGGGQVLLARQVDERLPPASLTKLMTALLVAESGRYFDQVTIEPGDLVGGSSMGLVSGERLAVRDLLDGLLVASGNDAAAALARHIGAGLPGNGRPTARFAARMNARAAELGMAGTQFRNSTGLDEPGHHSTAADLARLARAALRQPVIAQIVAQPTASVRGVQRAYSLRSTNPLFGRVAGVLGVKTGTTDGAGECLIALVERDGRRLLAVLLGSDDRLTDAQALLEWGFEAHRWLEPPAALAAAAAWPGWSASLASGPPTVVPAAQVQFVEHRLRIPPERRREGLALETVVLGRLVAIRPISLSVPTRGLRPLPE